MDNTAAPVTPCSCPDCPDPLGGPTGLAGVPRRTTLAAFGLEGSACRPCYTRIRSRHLAGKPLFGPRRKPPGPTPGRRHPEPEPKPPTRPDPRGTTHERPVLWSMLAGPVLTREVVRAWRKRDMTALTRPTVRPAAGDARATWAQ